jgi:magnesium chelatase subunit D
VDVIDTLRAAAPWQPLRRRGDAADARLRIAVDDLRIKRFKQRRTTTTVFVVDASGSSALHRLAEAKGAVELLLAECYVRRDRVALVAFRGVGAEVLLPPTRSLVRAKRLLAALPGGGATPLAAGLDAAAGLADQLRRVGDTPVVVLLTDGRANVARNGSMQREQAALDARAAARRLRAAQTMSVWLDTSAQPQPQARALAEEMGARYLPLPYADASAVAHVARAVR